MGGLGCDNMTVILACFLHGGSYSELAERCSKKHVTEPKRESYSNIDQLRNNKILSNGGDDERERDYTEDFLYNPPGGASMLGFRGSVTASEQNVNHYDGIGSEGVKDEEDFEYEDEESEIGMPIETTV